VAINELPRTEGCDKVLLGILVTLRETEEGRGKAREVSFGLCFMRSARAVSDDRCLGMVTVILLGWARSLCPFYP
jgi:hypothetical protein